MKKLALLLVFSNLFLIGTSQIYVDSAATGANNGSNWNDAYVYLQDALDNSLPNDSIWVAKGTYYPDEGANQINNSNLSTFNIPDSVKVFGGFNGSEILFTQRDCSINNTILSGYINPDNEWNRSLHVVTFEGVSEQTTLDGFIIKDGKTHYINDDKEKTNTLKEVPEDIHFFGGGILNFAFGTEISNPRIQNCIVTDNYADYGGGFCNLTQSEGMSYPLVYNCIFKDNLCAGSGANVCIYTRDTGECVIKFDSCEFKSSLGNTIGVGMFCNSDVSSFDSIILDKCIFRENESITGYGAGLYVFGSNMNVMNSKFIGNHAGGLGGAIYNFARVGQTFLLTNCLFIGNSADQGGGGALFSGNEILMNCSFSGNGSSWDNSSAIYFESSSNSEIFNSVIWGNENGIAGNFDEIHNDSGNPTFYNSNIKNSGGSGSNWNTEYGNDGGNNWDIDPMFAKTPIDTAQIYSCDGDLRLLVCSPMIDAGTTENAPLYDIEGTTREGNPDIGAYEQNSDIDTTAPIIYSNAIDVYLDENGMANISLDDIVSDVWDNCGVDTVFADKLSFNCEDIGSNDIQIYAYDDAGNTTTDFTAVRVFDTISPMAITNNLTVYLIDSVSVINVNQVNNYSTENCSIDTMFLSQTTFNCSNIGENTVWFYVYDNSGNSDSAEANINVLDTVSPIIQCPENIKKMTNTSAMTYLVEDNEFDPTVISDNCGDYFITNNINGSFTLEGEELLGGMNSITWTVEDNSGNTATCALDVKVYNHETDFIDYRDNSFYTWIQIDTQMWMAENMNYYLPENSFLYDDNENNSFHFGRLYTYNGTQEACPEGWRVPSDNDWKNLELFIGIPIEEIDLMYEWRGTSEGDDLKSTDLWEECQYGLDTYGFNAKPAGYMGYINGYMQIFEKATFWTNTVYDNSNSRIVRTFMDCNSAIHRSVSSTENALSLRCIKDTTILNIEVNIEFLKFNIYPNPSSGKMTIEKADSEEQISIRILNSVGSLIFEKEFIGKEINIDLCDQPAGMYTIQFVDNDIINRVKLVKQ